MQPSYRALTDDHVHIRECAERLLIELDQTPVEIDRVADQLAHLALFVRDHIAIEARIVDLCDAKPLPTPWRAAWLEGRQSFERLKTDWLDFLGDWDRDTIIQDLAGFRDAATAMLGRIGERVDLETRAFYAVALQTGAITFR